MIVPVWLWITPQCSTGWRFLTSDLGRFKICSQLSPVTTQGCWSEEMRLCLNSRAVTSRNIHKSGKGPPRSKKNTHKTVTPNWVNLVHAAPIPDQAPAVGTESARSFISHPPNGLLILVGCENKNQLAARLDLVRTGCHKPASQQVHPAIYAPKWQMQVHVSASISGTKHFQQPRGTYTGNN